jgi:hypothetical protein
MIRSLYFVGGLLAMALILFAHNFDLGPLGPLGPSRHAGAPAQGRGAAPLTASAPDPVATAIDDLAAWPAVAGR